MAKTMSRFLLQPRTWYAMEYTLPSGERHCSPIWVFEALPKKTGRGELEIRFWHVNYSEGAQDKAYLVSMVHREAGYLLALREHSREHRAAVLIREITSHWLRTHFGSLASSLRDDDNLKEWLDRHCPHPEA